MYEFRRSKEKYEIRKFLLSENGDRCWLCSNNFNEMPTIDHLIPKSEGGQLSLINSRLAHSWCNKERNRNKEILNSKSKILKCLNATCNNLFTIWFVDSNYLINKKRYFYLCACCQFREKFFKKPWKYNWMLDFMNEKHGFNYKI